MAKRRNILRWTFVQCMFSANVESFCQGLTERIFRIFPLYCHSYKNASTLKLIEESMLRLPSAKFRQIHESVALCQRNILHANALFLPISIRNAWKFLDHFGKSNRFINVSVIKMRRVKQSGYLDLIKRGRYRKSSIKTPSLLSPPL